MDTTFYTLSFFVAYIGLKQNRIKCHDPNPGGPHAYFKYDSPLST